MPILDDFGQKAVNLLKEKIAPYRATGKTEQSIRYEAKQGDGEYVITVYGRKYFFALETGRGPRENTEYKKFDQSLEEWMQVKGFASKTSKTGVTYYRIGDQWYSGKSLAWKINKQGDKTYREGGREIFSEALKEFEQNVRQEVINKIRDGFNFKASGI